MSEILRRMSFLFVAMLFTVLLAVPATPVFAVQKDYCSDIPGNQKAGETDKYVYNDDGTCSEVPKVTICHRSNAATNPYQVLSVAVSAVDGVAGNSGQVPDHYGEHTGPLASSEAVAKQLKKNKIDWGDIIPPVSGHDGLNWTTAGQAIYNNDCAYVEVEDADYYFQFAKEWSGDEVDLSDVTVTFYIGDKAWALGDEAVLVELGQKLSPLSETVMGLPENCTYKSDLPKKITLPTEPEAYGEDNTYTQVVTNKVTCKKDKNEYYLQFEKVWTGDSIDTTKLTVEFTGNIGEDDFSWAVGDYPREVKPGKTVITNLDEKVTGMPANCTYATNLPPSVSAPKKNSGEYDNNNVATVVVTNDVTCEDDDDTTNGGGVVAGDSTTTPSTPAPQVLATATTTPSSLPATGSNEIIAAATISLIAGFMAVTSLVAKKLFVKLS